MIRNGKIEEQKVGDMVVLFDTESFRFYELNGTMGFIWDMLKTSVTKKDIIAGITKEFSVDRKRAEADVEKAIDNLRKKKLISGE